MENEMGVRTVLEPKEKAPPKEWWVMAERDRASVIRSTGKPIPHEREDGTAVKVFGPYQTEQQAMKIASEKYAGTVSAFVDRLRAGKAAVS